QNTVNTLKKVNADIIGTILHAVDNTRNKYQYYYGNE
ncbi:MAG: capsular biosynthesis protein, partial [Clostridium saudiense]|nr:capsular biosynthesis protein [Clostridium saudiense]